MLNLFKKNSPIDKETLIRILDETVSTRLENKNFKYVNGSVWHTDNKNSITQVIKYVKLKGEQGTFCWGVCLDFVQTISDNKMKYHGTNKSVTLHLFEWPNEYYGTQTSNNLSTHWGEKEARQSIKKLFNNCEKKILDWFENSNNINSLIGIANRQIKTGKDYNLHSPNPKYVLAFLLAKNGEIDKAISTFEQLSEFDNNEELRNKIKQELTNIGT